MAFALILSTENAAFDDAPAELARILRDTADRLERQGSGAVGRLNDANGNKVGGFVLNEGGSLDGDDLAGAIRGARTYLPS